MLAGITVNTNTYFVWQTVVAVLTVISTGVSLWRMRQGTNKDEMTYFREEVMSSLAEIKDDVERTTNRLENHIDRNNEGRRH